MEVTVRMKVRDGKTSGSCVTRISHDRQRTFLTERHSRLPVSRKYPGLRVEAKENQMG